MTALTMDINRDGGHTLKSLQSLGDSVPYPVTTHLISYRSADLSSQSPAAAFSSISSGLRVPNRATENVGSDTPAPAQAAPPSSLYHPRSPSTCPLSSSCPGSSGPRQIGWPKAFKLRRQSSFSKVVPGVIAPIRSPWAREPYAIIPMPLSRRNGRSLQLYYWCIWTFTEPLFLS